MLWSSKRIWNNPRRILINYSNTAKSRASVLNSLSITDVKQRSNTASKMNIWTKQSKKLKSWISRSNSYKIKKSKMIGSNCFSTVVLAPCITTILARARSYRRRRDNRFRIRLICCRIWIRKIKRVRESCMGKVISLISSML